MRVHAMTPGRERPERRLAGATVFAALAFGLWTMASDAEANCGPGQRMVGLRNAAGAAVNGGPAAIPICAPDNTSAAGSANALTPEIPLSPLNAAVIWANDPQGRPVYVYTALRLSSIGAVNEAIAACIQAGGRHCRPGITAAGGWIGISKAADGSYFAAHARRKREAEKAAFARCTRDAAGCEVVELVRNEP